MLENLKNGMSETQENQEGLEQKDLGKDPLSESLEDGMGQETDEGVQSEGNVESSIRTLGREEGELYNDCSEVVLQQMLEQYALDDQEALSELEKRGDSAETGEGQDGVGLTVEGGRSCGSAGGCSGSTWCYGCGDLK